MKKFIILPKLISSGFHFCLNHLKRKFIRQQKTNGELPTWEEFVEEHESYWASRTNDNVV